MFSIAISCPDIKNLWVSANTIIVGFIGIDSRQCHFLPSPSKGASGGWRRGPREQVACSILSLTLILPTFTSLKHFELTTSFGWTGNVIKSQCKCSNWSLLYTVHICEKNPHPNSVLIFCHSICIAHLPWHSINVLSQKCISSLYLPLVQHQCFYTLQISWQLWAT